jgi:hypothetical protein
MIVNNCPFWAKHDEKWSTLPIVIHLVKMYPILQISLSTVVFHIQDRVLRWVFRRISPLVLGPVRAVFPLVLCSVFTTMNRHSCRCG